MELAVEPVGEPPSLSSRRWLARERLEQPGIALIGGIAQIFGNGIGAHHRAMLIGDQYRQRPGRVQRHELLAPFPRPLLGELGLDPALGEGKPDRPGKGAERIMQQSRH